MSYGQKNYNEIQGINGKYRINQIGCFVTAFCNLLDRFGKGVGDPIAMNRILRDNGIYVDVDDGIRDDLAYGSVSRVNGNIVVTGTGSGRPPHNNCIVKFTGLNNGFGTHFCLVADAAAGTIVDSWDGVVKSWNVYGGPKQWAAYEDRSPKPTPTPAPAPVLSNNDEVVAVQRGWGLSHVAQAAGYADFKEPSRWAEIAALNGSNNWQIFNSALKTGQLVRVRAAAVPTPAPQPAPQAPQQPEIINITVQPGWGITHVLKAAGYTKEQWDNEAEWDRVAALNGSATRLRLKPNQVVRVYRQPLPLNQPAPTPAPVAPAEAPQPVAPVVDPPKQAAAPVENEDGSVTVPVTVVPKDPNAWKKTFKEEDLLYIANESMIIKDLEGLHQDLQLVEGQKVNSGGSFEKEDEEGHVIEYARTKNHIKQNMWYGVPKSALGAGQNPNTYVGPLKSDDDDDDLFNLDLALEAKEALKNLSSREKFVGFLARLSGFFASLFGRKNKK